MPEKITLLGKKFKLTHKDNENNNDTLSLNLNEDEKIIITLKMNSFSVCYSIKMKDYALFNEYLNTECIAVIESITNDKLYFKTENGKIFCALMIKICNRKGKCFYIKGIVQIDWHELVEI